MSSFAAMLKIEIDGHFHGGEPVKPWVAKILGPDPKFGLAREFVDPLNDWSNTHRAWSGRVYGRVSHFPLRDGHLYEVSRCRGRSSKRHVVREFLLVEDGNRRKVTADEVLARVNEDPGAGLLYRLPEDPDAPAWVARVTGLGVPEQLGFVVDDGARVFRLRDGLYQVGQGDERKFIGVRDQRSTRLTHDEALAWLGLSHS